MKSKRTSSAKVIADAITPVSKVKKPNQVLTIFKGKCVVGNKYVQYFSDSKIEFTWYPQIGLKIKGEVEFSDMDFFKLMNEKCEVRIDNKTIGKCHITNISSSGRFSASFTGESVLFDKEEPVEKVHFEIPNLKDYSGEVVVKQSSYIFSGRLVFKNQDYTITIDKSQQISKLINEVKNQGGYIVTWVGILQKNETKISFKEAEEILECFSQFLFLISGRRISPIFRKGITNRNIKWIDYRGYFNDPYKYVSSWVYDNNMEDVSNLWQSFSSLWEKDKYFLKSALHWYIEANNQSGYTDGAIIMAQTGLELLYNWLVVEDKNAIQGDDAEKISASNKIRLILSFIGLEKKLPSNYNALHNHFVNEKNIDGPEAFVRVRNTIVHSNLKKRKQLEKSDNMVRYQALQLGIMYVELTLLYILGYNGKYLPRGESHRKVQPVPWLK